MGRKKANHPLIESLEIVAVAAEGKALGRWNDIVVFVPMAVPGDVVDVQVCCKRRRYMEGRIVRFVRRSPLRVEPVCEHFGVCGGCKWQNMPYDEQLRFKQEQVAEQLKRIGGIELPEIPGLFDKVLDIRKCWLQPDPSNAIRQEVRAFCIDRGYSFYDIREHRGLMRNLIVRTASTGEVMAIVVFGEDDRERIDALLSHTKERFPGLASLMWVVNTKLNDTIGDLEIRLHSGRDHIFEEMESLRFKVGPKSFYQTNSSQAYELYKIVREFAALTGQETVYDLYTGTGTIANFVAARASRVIGVEYVPEAIEDARTNSRLNGIDNTTFYAGDMKNVLDEAFVERNGRPDVVILDPPRAGLHEDVARTILGAAPGRIVYVSCNPATQARDLALLDADYRVLRIQPVDMFPHTHHVENVVLLVRRDRSESDPGQD